MASLALDNALLILAMGALAAGGHRVAGRLTADRQLRRLVTVVLVAAVAVLEALVLGRVGASGRPGALCLLAVLTGAAAWRLAGPVPAGADGEPREAARGRPARGGPVGFGAAAGALAGVTLIELHRPILGQDAVTYHLPEVIGWVQSGHTGRILDVYYGLPVGAYPITQEVLLAWAAGLAHSWAALLLLTLAAVPLLGLAGWITLRELGVPPAVAGLGLSALAVVPLITQAWVQPGTDLAAVGWLAATIALCLGARREPGLLAVALVAGGLAIGTKTTVASYTVVGLSVALWSRRARLRDAARPLLAGAGLAVAVGLVWYLRNWVDHGSPLWPFASFPDGDRRPAIIDFLSTPLLSSLHATLLVHLHAYLDALSGGTVLLVGGGPGVLLVGLLGRRRRLIVAGSVTTLGTLLYAAGPVTGVPPHGGAALLGAVGSTLRYLMPAWAAGTVALALLAAEPQRRVAALGWLGLIGATAWSVRTDLPQHFSLASSSWLWIGLALGALAGAVAQAPALRPRIPPSVRGLAVLSVLLAVLTLGSRHFSLRHAVTHDYASTLTAALVAQPGWATTRLGVATEPTGLATLAGDRLEHPLGVIAPDAPCARIARLARTRWIVTAFPPAHLTPALRRVTVVGTTFNCIEREHARLVYADGIWAIAAPPDAASPFRRRARRPDGP